MSAPSPIKVLLVCAAVAAGIYMVAEETFPGFWRSLVKGGEGSNKQAEPLGGSEKGSPDGDTLRVLVLSLLMNESPDAPGDVAVFIHESDGQEGILQAVVEALRHPSSVVRRNAASVAGLMRWKRAREALGAAVQDVVPEVRRAVVSSLVLVGDERSLFALVMALKDSEWSIRAGAAEAIGSRCGPKGVPYLWTALGDPDSLVREMAADGLVRAVRGENRQFLENRLFDPNPFKRQTAERAIAKISVQAGD